MFAGATLATAFGVRPGEGRTVALLLGHSCFVGIVQLFTARAAEPLFLVAFGAQNLPYLYIAAAGATMLVGFLYARLAARIAFITVSIVNLSVLLFVTCALRLLLLIPDARWPIMVLAIWATVQYVLINVEFWGLAGRLFNLRQSKRLFGLIGAGEVAATIGGGLLTPWLVRLVGTPNLLWIAAGGIVGALLCLVSLARVTAITTDLSTEEGADVSRTDTYRSLLKHRYIVLIVACTSLSWLGWYVVDNLFFEQAAARYADADQLASFLGVFGATAGCLTLLGRTFATGPVISRYGLRVGLLAYPVIVAASAALVAVSGTLVGAGVLVFWLAMLTKLASDVLEASIYQSSFRLLYQPLPPRQRLFVQTTVETLVEPVAVACAGVLLLVLITWLGFGTIQLASVVVVMFVLLSAVGVALARAYPAALLRALSRRRLGDGATIVADRSTVAVLQEGLRSPHVGVVGYALDQLESISHGSLEASLQALLYHSDPYVRHDVLLKIERLGLTRLLPAVRQRVELEPSAPIRATALRVLAELGESDDGEAVAAYLHDPDPSVRLGAMVGLLRSGGIEGVLLAGGTLLDLAKSSIPRERVLAARALGEVGNHSFYRPLVPLLQDDAPQVRAAALEAAGKLKNVKLWPLVVHSLADPAVRSAAAAALVAGGDTVLPALRALFAERTQPRAVLIRAAQICGRIGGPGAIALLEAHVASADTDVRGQVLAALHRSGYQVRGEGVARIHSQVTAEVAFAAWTVTALADIGDGPEVALLHSALSYQLQQNRERLFLLLSFIYDSQAILRARDNLMHASGGKRAYAQEVLDLLVAQDLKPGVFAVLDDLAPAERSKRLRSIFPQPGLDRAARLCDVVTSSTVRQPWVAACALYTLTRVSSPAWEEIVALGFSAPNVLVRETAAWVEWKLAPNAPDRSGAVAADVSHAAGAWRDRAGSAGERTMLSTIEKVLTLKSVSIFAGTPDETLVEAAAILEEVDIPEGRTIFEKGEMGSCLYIIADGRVRVHDGERTLNELGTGDVFGEMAVLDAAPRVASVTALDATRLLRLDQEPLYELMADRIEVVRAIVGVLSGHLRARVHDVAELSARIQELTHATDASAGAPREQL